MKLAIPQVKPGALLRSESPLSEEYAMLAARLIPPTGVAQTTRGELLASMSFVYMALHEDRIELCYGSLRQRLAVLVSFLHRTSLESTNASRLLEDIMQAFGAYEVALGAWSRRVERDEATDEERPKVFAYISEQQLEDLAHYVVVTVAALDRAAAPVADVGVRVEADAVELLRRIAAGVVTQAHDTPADRLAAVEAAANKFFS